MAGKNLLAEEPSTGGKNLLAGEPREKPFGQKVMEYAVTPALETVGTIVGGTIGGGGGTIFGPIGTAVGTVGGAGTGYATGKYLGELGEQALGYRKPPASATEGMKRTAKDIVSGAEYEMGGKLIGEGASALYRGAKSIPEMYRTLRGTPYKESAESLKTTSQDLANQLIAQERAAGRETYGAQRQARLGAQAEAEAAKKQAEQIKSGFGVPQDKSVTGSQLMSDIKAVSDKNWQARKTLADKTYSSAWESTRAKQAAGDYWQNSPSGKNFFNTLEKKIQTSDITPVSSAEEKEIRSIIGELQGKQVGSTPRLAYDPQTGLMSMPSEPKFAPLDIKAVVEQLRKLREAQRGFAEEGFKAISQKRAGAMAKSLEESIAGWDKSLRQADNTYKQMSERLYPEQTARGETILARQRYNLDELSRDPQKAADLFFSSKQGVEDLTRLLGGDKTRVAQYARQHAINELSSKKTAAEAERWASNRNNIDWMNEIPGLRQEVNSYVNSLIKAESKGKAAEGLSKTMKTAGRQTAQRMVGQMKDLRSEAFAMENADPEKVVSLARGFAQKLEKEGLASPRQIAQFEREIQETDALHKGRDKARRIAVLAAKLTGVGYGSYEATRLMQGR